MSKYFNNRFHRETDYFIYSNLVVNLPGKYMNSKQESQEIIELVNETATSPIDGNLKTEVDSRSSYSEKTHRIFARSELIKSLSQFIKSVTPIIWTVVIVIILIGVLGKISIGSIGGKYISKLPGDILKERVVITAPSIPSQLNNDLILALKDSRTSAETYASEKLDEWIDQLRENVNDDFLNWYFNYFTQLNVGLKATFLELSSLINLSSNPNLSDPKVQKAQKLTEDFQREFAKRVLKPEVAQIKLERFTRETINTYVSELSKRLTGIQSEYKIPQADWERYLSGVSTTILDSTGNNQDLSLRVLSRGTEYLVALPLSKLTVKMGGGLVSQIAEGVAAKAAIKTSAKITTKVSTKAAGKVASEFTIPTLSTIGLELIDPLAAVGILAWDVWDNYHTDQVERPKMRKAIFEYLDEMKQVLLYNPNNSIMSAIYTFEGGLIDKLEKNQPN